MHVSPNSRLRLLSSLFLSRPCRGIIGGAVSVVLLIDPAAFGAGADPANPQLSKWTTSKYNCYNYALNSQTKQFQQPKGLSAKYVYDASKPSFTATDVMDSAVADGLVSLGSPGTPPATPDGKSLVALVYDPTKGFTVETAERYKLGLDGKPIPDGFGGYKREEFTYKEAKCDYHWYRYNMDQGPGKAAPVPVWSDKPGETPAKIYKKKTDATVNADNPKTDGNGNYTEFLGYYSVTPGGGPAKVADPDEGVLFERAGEGARGQAITKSGIQNQFSDIGAMSDLRSLLLGIASQPQVSDPNWLPFFETDPVNHFGGYAITPDDAAALGAMYVRDYQGVVAMYDDFNGTSSSIRFYNDPGNQLSDFLAAQIVPEPGTLSLLGMGVIGLGLRRSRANKNKPQERVAVCTLPRAMPFVLAVVAATSVGHARLGR